MATESRPRARTRRRLVRWPVGLGIILAASYATRLAFGLHLPLEADESTIAYQAVQISHGNLSLVEPNAHYLGAVESYLVAPWVMALGPTLLAVRAAMATVGVLYVLAMFGLGRALFHYISAGLLTSSMAAVFPLFAFTWDMKSRGGYAELLVFSTLLLTLAIRLGWGPRPARRWWVLFGLVAGVALWTDLLALGVVLITGIALVLRAPERGWHSTRRGLLWAGASAAMGFSPWLIWQVSHRLAGLHSLPKDHASVGHAVSGLLKTQLPIFMGAASSCRGTTALFTATWPWLGVVLFAVVAAGFMWVRRGAIGRLLRLQLSAFEPLEMVLVLAPVALLTVILGRGNSNSCEPRYLLPLSIPLVVAAVVLLRSLGRRGTRALAAVVSAGWLAVMGVAASLPTVDSIAGTSDGTLIPTSASSATTAMDLVSHQPQSVFGDYWLMRPLQFLTEGRVPIGIVGGPIGFPADQRRALAAPHPSWLVVPGEALGDRLRTLMHDRGITAQLINVDGLDLYANLSQPLHPADVGGTDAGSDQYYRG